MENVFMKTSFRQSSPIRLSNLSPQKYGKAAYDQNRTFTPSKLADNVLYRQVTTLKKVQEGNGKARQFQAFNSLLKQRLAQAEQQKQGIQKTLNQQIVMYKKMLKQKQQKNQTRLRQIQCKFRQEIRQIIEQKQQQAKYFQSQKQIFQTRIQELQSYVNQLSQRLNNQGGAYNDLKNQKEKLQMQKKNLQQKYDKMESQKNIQINKLQERLKSLSQQYKQAQNKFKIQFEGALYKKDIERKSIQQRLSNELNKLQSLRLNQNAIKDNQISQLRKFIQTEILRHQHLLEAEILKNQRIRQAEALNNQRMRQTQASNNQRILQAEVRKSIQMLNVKQSMIQRLNRDYSQAKKTLADLHNQNAAITNEITDLQTQNRSLAFSLKECDQLFGQQKQNLLILIEDLKQQIRLSQINYVREKDRNDTIYGQTIGQNMRIQHQTQQKEVLLRQIAQLRQLLMESSREIQLCRQRFVSFERQNKKLRFQVQRIASQNDSLLRLRRQLEEEAVKWRQNYLRIAH